MIEKKIFHKDLAGGRWFEFSLMEQLANVGSDVERIIQWRKKGNLEYSRQAFERSLELLSLTVADQKNKWRLKEILLIRELLVDYFMYDNQYASSDEFWQKYFLDIGYAAAIQRGR